MPLRDMRTSADHELCPLRENPRSTGCDYCGSPAVQEWSAPNGSYGHFCQRHRHKYGLLERPDEDAMVIIVPEAHDGGEGEDA